MRARAEPRQRKELSTAQIANVAAIARAFLTEFAIDPKCAVFTSPPNNYIDGAPIAKAVAEAVGGYVILPDLTGVVTLDGNHLDQQSAERWSAAFLQEYAPIMERCLSPVETADPSQTSNDID
jgi:hypothetical protein